MSQQVTFAAACPACGTDAEWIERGPRVFVGSDRMEHDITVRCPNCDAPEVAAADG